MEQLYAKKIKNINEMYILREYSLSKLSQKLEHFHGQYT